MKRSEPRIGDLDAVARSDARRPAGAASERDERRSHRPSGASAATVSAADATSPAGPPARTAAPTPSLFGFRGRLPRLRFVVHLGASVSLPTAMVAAALTPLHDLHARTPQLAAALAAASLALVLLWQVSATCRRLHDLGLSGWLAALVVLPGVNLLVVALLALWPGQPGTNRHGPPAPGNGLLVWLGYLLLVLAPLGLAPAAALYYDDFLQQRQARSVATG